MCEVVLDRVSKEYADGVFAVKDASFEIHDREFVVLVGPSGCGKSTTLRMVAGLEEISHGEIRIDGKVVNNVPPKDRDIAMVFQNYALYPHMTVRENMAFGLKLRKFPKTEIEERVNEAASILELSKLLDRKPKALSGGQRQRVALGRAIVRKPKIFLFDEPLSNLDAKLRGQMRTEILKLHQRLEATMLYVTHDQVEAMTMGTKIVVLKDGAIQQIDSPLDLYNKPVNKFVAGFIGSPTMNFITGTVKENRFTSGNFICPLPERLKGISGGDYILGIRSENLHVEESAERVGSVRGNVDIVEMMGSESYLHVEDGVIKLIARVRPTTGVKIGDKITFHFNPERIHLFNPQSQEVIRSN